MSSDAFRRSHHAGLALVPACGANFAMLFEELQGIDRAQHFVDIAAERQHVDVLVHDHAGLVDQEGATQRHTGRFEFNVVGAADVMLDVGHQRIANLADAAVLDCGVLPGKVRGLGVDGHANHFYATLLELFQTMIKGDQFRRADKGEVERVEKQDDRLALELGQFQFLDFVVAINGGGGEVRGLALNENGHYFYCFVSSYVY